MCCRRHEGDRAAFIAALSYAATEKCHLRTTPHHLQSKAANTGFMAPLEGVRLNCIGKPQNGQCGWGASVSMRPNMDLHG
jgi:hypothetical protein